MSYISTANDVDYYVFAVSTTQHVRVDLTIPAGTTYGVAVLGPGTFEPQVLTQSPSGGVGLPRRLDWTLTPGTYWVRVTRDCCGSQSTQPYVLTLTAPQPGDTFEPNETAATAAALPSGSPRTSYVATANDVDFYVFTLATTQHVRVDLTIPAGTTYGVAILGQGTFGPQVITQSPSGGLGLPRRLDWTLTPGTYWVRVSHDCCGTVSYNATQPYVLTLTAPQLGDTSEPNETAATAAALPSGSPRTSYIATANDVDFYVFTLATTQHVRVDLTIPAGTTYGVAILGQGTFGPQVLTQSPSGGLGLPRRLDWTLTPGTYWVRVSHDCCGSITYNAAQPYILTLTAPQPGDTFEPNETAATAAPLPSGSPRTSYIATANDVDFYAFSVGTTQQVRVDLTIPAGTTYGVAILGQGTFGPQVVTQSLSGGLGLPRRLDWTLTPGTYWVQVSHDCCASVTYYATQPYVLTLAAGGVTAPPAAPTITALSPVTPVASGSNQFVTVSGAGFQAGQTVTVGLPGGGTSTLSGTQIQNVNPTSFQMIVTLADAGTYWITVNTMSGTSNQVAFSVSPPPVPPVVTAVNPAAPEPASGDQVLLVAGSGFQAGQTVSVGLPGGGRSTLSGTQVFNVTSNTFQVAVTLLDAGTYSLRVHNAAGTSPAFFLPVGSRGAARPAVDDYPLKDDPCQEYVRGDEWGFFSRECTSFVAWRMNRDAGVRNEAFNNRMNGRLKGIRSEKCPNRQGYLSHAKCWADQLGALGYTVNSIPSVGAIAHWTSDEIGNENGHVAYVRAVNSDGTVDVEEYNFAAVCGYSHRLRVRAPRYIHVNAADRATTAVDSATNASINLASSGGVVGVAFARVTAPGTATVTHEALAPSALGAVPPGFVPLTESVFDVSSDAGFGGVDVCFGYTPAQLSDARLSADSVRVLHLTDGASHWTDVTLSVNPTKREVCGRVTTLSRFVLAAQPIPDTLRYLAEGATSSFFDTKLAILNPDGHSTTATVTVQTTTGAVLSSEVAIPARTRVSLDPKALFGLTSAEFSTVVNAPIPLVVDRTMSWDASAYGAHAETAAAAPATTWYLAEGATHSGFNLFYLLQNPSSATTRVRVRYLLTSGAPLEKEYHLPPSSRTNIWVNVEEFAGTGRALAAAEPSAVIESLDGTKIIVERAMYLSNGGRQFNAGHASMGITTPSTDWFLAEGATGDYFDLFVLIANPNDEDATVDVTYLLGDGTTYRRSLVAAANSRSGIWVDMEEIPGVPGRPLQNAAVSTLVTSTNAVPVIVERAMWWPGSAGTWHEAHNSAGATHTGTRWALAEGEVGGPRGHETYILIANTSAHAGSATVTLMFEDGTSAVRSVALLPNSRTNVSVAAEFNEAHGRRFGAVVESTGSTPAEIVVERAMYSNAGGVQWAAGTNALATRLR